LNTRIIFMGTPDFASVILESLCIGSYEVVACVTQPDKPMGRHMTLMPPPAKIMAISKGIPVLQPNSIRTDAFIDQLREFAPDLIVTAAYGKILPAAVLDVPVSGCINVHASLLPRYRGAAPVQWAILNGDSVTGITIMKMDVGMDTGDILRQQECPIDHEINSTQLMRKLAVIGADLLHETLRDYLGGTCPLIRQDSSLATMSPPIRKEQGLIDWSQPSQSIHNQIRALCGWPGAFTFYNGNRFKIYKSEVKTDEDTLLQTFAAENGDPLPGTVISPGKSVLAVACGDGALYLTSVQPESCRRMDASECAHNYRTGTRFDGEYS
jgi:methionyl-tRNA formyltransferase